MDKNDSFDIKMILIVFIMLFSLLTQIPHLFYNTAYYIKIINYDTAKNFRDITAIVSFSISLAIITFLVFFDKKDNGLYSKLVEITIKLKEDKTSYIIIRSLIVGIICWSFFAQLSWLGLKLTETPLLQGNEWFVIFFKEFSMIAIVLGVVGGFIVSGLIPTKTETTQEKESIMDN